MSVNESEPAPGKPQQAAKIYVGPGRVGQGVFAGHALPEGCIIGEILGRILRQSDYGSDYCIDLGEGYSLEPAGPFRFLNHSCQPNCEVFMWNDEPRKIWVATLRGINPDEELTIDYGWPAEEAIPCQCGAADCRGWVVAADQLQQLRELNDTPPEFAGE